MVIRVITIGRNPPSKVLNKQPSLKAFNSLPIEKMTKEPVPDAGQQVDGGKSEMGNKFKPDMSLAHNRYLDAAFKGLVFLQTNLVNFARAKEGNCTTSISNTIITASV